jgi:hypothetical protein
MSSFSLDLREDFADHEWESEGERLVRPSAANCVREAVLYDPVRLRQEIESELERGEVFFEPNLVIIQSVTRANMERAAALLVESGQIAALVAHRAN